MNKDEMKMIEEMCKILNFNCKIECDKCQANEFCSTYFECKALYNANCRIIADDEIVVKMTDIMDLNNKAQGTTDFLRDKLAEISKQIDEATKIADDEIVIKKSEYEALKKAKNIIQLDISEEFLKECEYEMRELEQKTKQETAKKIFEDIEFYGVRSLNDEIWGNHFKLMDSTLSDLKMKYKAE